MRSFTKVRDRNAEREQPRQGRQESNNPYSAADEYSPDYGQPRVGQNSSGTLYQAPQPSSLEVFWGLISCSPVAPQTIDDSTYSVSRQQQPPNYYLSPSAAAAEERARNNANSDNRVPNDLDLISRRLKESAIKKKNERKGVSEEELLGDDFIIAQRRLMQEEQYKKDKMAEFQRTQAMQKEAIAEAERKRLENANVFDSLKGLDVSFGLTGLVTRALGAEPISGFEAEAASGGTTVVSTLPQADRERFDQLLGIEGLPVLVYLPTREGGSKSRRAVLRCERNSTNIVCEIAGKSESRTKSIRFDVRIVKAVRVGAGVTVKVPTDYTNGDSLRFHFVLQDKPDLTCELESKEARDVSLAGFVYIVSTRRSPLYMQQIQASQPLSIGKGDQSAVLPSKSRSDRSKCLSGWNKWWSVAEKSMMGLRTKWKPRLFLLTTKGDFEVYAKLEGGKDEEMPPSDMIKNGPLRRYLDGRWDRSVLEGMGYEYLEDLSCRLVEISTVTSTGETSLQITYNSDEKAPLQVKTKPYEDTKEAAAFLAREVRIAKKTEFG